MFGDGKFYYKKAQKSFSRLLNTHGLAFLGTFLLGTSAVEIARIALTKYSDLDLLPQQSYLIAFLACLLWQLYAYLPALATSPNTSVGGLWCRNITDSYRRILSGEIIMARRDCFRNKALLVPIRRMANAFTFFQAWRGILSKLPYCHSTGPVFRHLYLYFQACKCLQMATLSILVDCLWQQMQRYIHLDSPTPEV